MTIDYAVEVCNQAERAVVGSSIISAGIIPAIRAFMMPERFYNAALGDTFGVICSLADSRSPIDIVTVGQALGKKGVLDGYGGVDFLRALIDSVAFADHGEHYAKIASGYYYDREIIKASRVVSEDKSAESLEKLRDLVLSKERLGLPATFDYKNDLFDVLDKLLTKKTGRRHDVGFPSFDRIFGGLSPGEVVTWGAATNTGKSLILLNIASYCAGKGESVLYVGTEMSAEETVARHLSILTSVEPHKIRSARISPDEMDRLRGALSDRMFQMPIQVLDLPEPSLSDVEAALTAKRSQVVFLDYLERFKMPSGDNYRLRVNDFMRRVKNLARRYDVVVHLASQLSREVYGVEEKRPTLAHLSESSAIEKESDRVVLVWAPKEKNPVGIDTGSRVLEAVLAKNRHGRRGASLDLTLDEKSLRITEFESVRQESFQ